ncbi:MAG: phosphoribosylglycinamide formyltransferase [Hyphomicrobiaceae bacterium]
MSARVRVGVLISGRGSNMASLVEAAKAKDFPAEIALVVSNRPDAPGLEFATAAGVRTATVDHKKFDDRGGFERALHLVLSEAGIEFICNAGFMRLLTDEFVERWRNRQLNIHPSLLPAFKGLNTHERVIEAGARITGCTVHFVRTEMDSGPIVAQAAVPVLPSDTPDVLAARVLEAEHKLYPLALRLVAAQKVRVVGEDVIVSVDEVDGAALFSPGLTAG